jgi:hypothetical protein
LKFLLEISLEFLMQILFEICIAIFLREILRSTGT